MTSAKTRHCSKCRVFFIFLSKYIMTMAKKGKSVSLHLLQNREIGVKPVAKLVPAIGGFVGSMRDQISYEGDIISPIDVQWDAELDADPRLC